MPKKQVEICLKFYQLNVFGERIPSKCLFERVVDRYPNAGDRQLFCELSNLVVAELNKLINPLPGTHEFEWVEAMKQLAISSELSISKLLQSLAVTQWLIITSGNFTGGNRQKLERKTSKLIQFKKGKIGINKLDTVVTRKYSKFATEHIEYQIADNYIDLFMSKTRYLHDRHIELFGVFPLECEKSFFVFTCPYCQTLKVVKQGETPSTCGSDGCKTAYFTASKREKNPKKGWVHDPTARPRACLGGCGSDRKQLNSDRICFGCYPSDF